MNYGLAVRLGLFQAGFGSEQRKLRGIWKAALLFAQSDGHIIVF